MADWGGILAGAIGGGGKGVREIAEQHIENEGKLDVARELSDIEEQRAQRLAESAEARRLSGRQADTEQDLANAPRLRDSKVADARATGQVENELAVDKAKKLSPIEVETAKLRAKAELEVKASPENVEATRKLAQAAHIESAASLAQAELARLQVKDQQAAMALTGLLGRAIAAGDTVAVDAVTKQIKARNLASGKGAAARDPELDTQTVVDETTDDEGNVRKVTRKEVRKPDSATGKAPPVGTVVKGYAFMGGDHRDQSNWKKVN